MLDGWAWTCGIWSCPARRNGLSAEGCIQNFWGERYVYRQTPWGPMREDARGALAEAQTMADLERFDWPTPDQFDYAPWPSSANVGSRTPCSTVSPTSGSGRRWCGVGRRCSSTWSSGRSGPISSRGSSPISTKRTTPARPKRRGGRIDLFLVISDLGSQSGPLISVPMFREFVGPYIKEMVDCIHGLGAKVLYHSCGKCAR